MNRISCSKNQKDRVTVEEETKQPRMSKSVGVVDVIKEIPPLFTKPRPPSFFLE